MFDVSMRIDVLNFLGDVRDRFGILVFFVIYDLVFGYYISDMILIMYRGCLVEFGDIERVFQNLFYLYIRMFLESVFDFNVKWEFKGEIWFEVEERSVYEIGGCNYVFCCFFVIEKCWKVRFQVVEVEKNYWVVCYFYGGE